MSSPILIVEDESIVALDLQVRLEGMGYQVVGVAHTGEEGLRLAEALSPDLVLMDIHLGDGMDGIETATRIRATQDLPIVFLTAYADESTLARAKAAAPYGYLVKPFQELSLRSTLEMALMRHSLEMELRAREARLHALLVNAYDLVTIVNREGLIIYNSPAVTPMLGYDERENLGRKVLDLIHPEDQGGVKGSLSDLLQGLDVMRRATMRVRTKDGQWRILEAIGKNGVDLPGVEGIIINARDVTERVAAEEEHRFLERQVQQAQKLESLGVLAGGIAHDFNNLLMGILGQAGLALLDLPQSHPAHERVRRMELAAQRAAELTNQMLAYSGKGRFALAQIHLSRMVKEMAQLLDTVLTKRATVSLDLEMEIPPIEGDPAQLRQVVMNLLTNASDSLGDQGGTLHVRTGVMPTQPDMPCLVGAPPPVRAVFLEVQDNGCGMDADTLQRIFDPFFTTKFTGRGLGLSAVQGIVRGHNGGIQVKSTLGKGTTFRLLFPPSLQESKPDAAPQAPKALPRGSGLVLVVDDEAYVREVAQDALQRQGFTVLTAHDGQEGLELFLANEADVKALVLDLTMPRMGGEELLRRIRTMGHNTLPALLSSGYAEEELHLDTISGDPPRFLRKPYQPMELVSILVELTAPSTSSAKGVAVKG
jgi:two-component system cell cycle sensor histidine kinase/response regulator CckA